MKKMSFNGLKFTIGLLFAAVILQFNDGKAFGAEVEPVEYNLIVPDGTRVTDTIYELKTTDVMMSIVDDNNDYADINEIDVTWEISDPGVISTVQNPDHIYINRKAPGYSTVTAIIKEEGTENIIDTLSVEIKIDFKIDYQAMGLTTEGQVLELDIKDASLLNKEIALQYANGDSIEQSIYKDAFEWNSGNPQVATVDTTTVAGTITAVGAGSTNIYINAKSAKPEDIPLILTVAVKPTFTVNVDSVEYQSKQYKKEEVPTSHTPVIDAPVWDFFLRLDHGNVNNLKWVVKDTSTGMTINLDGTGKITSEVSDGGTSIHFTSVKAGVYDVYAFVGNDFDTTSDVTYAFMRIVVPIMFKQPRVIMSVGDIYKILDNSNVPSLNVLDSDNFPDTENILKYYPEGHYTARLKGETELNLRYNQQMTTPLYPNYIEVPETDFDIEIWVIDKISLNMTTATMYENGALQLEAIVSDPNLRVEWKSKNEALATVAKVDDNDDKRVAVTAKNLINDLSQDETVTITATLMDDRGVVKTVECEITVKRAVTNITIDPSKVTLHVGETAILDAVITPEVLNRETPVHWKTSDESIVSFTVYNNTSIRIEGKKAGRATITAIDQNNVIVGYCQVTVDKPVTSIELSETEIVTDLSTRYLQLEAIFTPADATNKEITWFSTNDRIATVDQYGVVTIKASGEVSIVATSVDNPNAKAICNIAIHTPVMSLQLEQNELMMKIGETATLSYILLPINASNKSVIWTSTNSSIADVDSNGKVTAKGTGNAVIILRSLDHGLTAYCTVKVSGSGSGSSTEDIGYKFDVEELELNTGDEYEIEVTFEDKGMAVTDLRWETTDTRIATVDHYGKIKAKQAGVVTISARNEDGDKVSLKLTVIEPIEDILLNFTEKEIRIGDKFNLTASVNPSNATHQKIAWVSSDPNIATVNKKGLVKGLHPGEVKITASVEGEEVTASCVVTVNEDATGIELNHISYRLGLGDKVTLKANVFPEFASENIKWVSNNTKVATVNSKGKVIGVSYGFATITATTKDGTELEASCEIEVVKPVKRVLLDQGYLSMMAGESKNLKATISPKSATYDTIKWTSSDDSIAIVDEFGVVTAIKAGKVDITAAAEDGSGKKAVCIVNIRAGIPATKITAMDKKVTMVPGEERTVKVVLNPVNSTDGVTWSSDNSSIVKVDRKTGKITARATGTASITVMTDTGKSAVVEVNVVGLNLTNLSIEQYTTYSELTVEGTTSRVNWSIDNPSVAKITKVGNNGLRISSRAIGKATITANVDGRKLKCKLTVTEIR